MWYAVFLASLAFYLYAKATKEVAEAMNRHTFLLRWLMYAVFKVTA
jgi:hypothetical protein